MGRAVILSAFSRGLAGTLAAVSLCAFSGCGSTRERAAIRQPGHGVRIGPTRADAPIDFAVMLRMPRERDLARFAASVQDPASGQYRRFLGAAAIGRRYGLPTGRLRRLEGQLQAAGVRVTESFPQRTELLVRGSAHAVGRLLRINLHDYRDGNGQTYHRPDRPPEIPLALSDALVSVAGLDTRPVALTSAIPAGGLSPRDVSRAYDVEPLHQLGLHGEGQTVAVISGGTFRPADIAAFDRRQHITGAPPIERVDVRGAVPYKSDGGDEVHLDLEVIRGLAPKAKIIDYETACCDPSLFAPAVDRVVADGRADLVNLSYGVCELNLNAGALKDADRSFAAAAARGITVFAAAGDDGAYDCQRSDLRDHRLALSWPGSSPNVVSVGGTLLDLRKDGSYLGEVGWENILTRAGGGGGVSAVFSRPAWQAGVPGLENRFTTHPARRQVPDVAATADSDSGYEIVTNGHRQTIGGTSAAAPFWTGAMVLARQLAQREHAGRLGFLAPVLYRLGARAPTRAGYHDIVLGGNRHYSAGPGWDYSTGLGTPDVARLASEIVTLLKSP